MRRPFPALSTLRPPHDQHLLVIASAQRLRATGDHGHGIHRDPGSAARVGRLGGALRTRFERFFRVEEPYLHGIGLVSRKDIEHHL